MRKVNIYFFSLLFFVLSDCCGKVYQVKLIEPIATFFNQKAEQYMVRPDSKWKIEMLNESKHFDGELLKHIKGFIAHNDRESNDCYELCCFAKILSDRQFKFSEDDKQELLRALEILAVWFWRDELGMSDEDREMFKTFDFSTLFIEETPIANKTNEDGKFCTIQ